MYGVLSKQNVFILGGLILGVIVLYALIGVSADWMAESLSDETETRYFGDLGAKQGWKKDPSTDDQKRAQRVFDKLLHGSASLRKLKYHLYFMADRSANAFAMPGGTVAVTEGLLGMVKGDVGLAMVIGHEFGHQQHRDSLKSMGRSLIIGGALALFAGDPNFLVRLAAGLADKSHSRSQESDADAYGIKMVYRAYGTTKGALEFFEKISSDPASKESKMLSILSTHPYTPDRITKLKKLAKELEERKKKAK